MTNSAVMLSNDSNQSILQQQEPVPVSQLRSLKDVLLRVGDKINEDFFRFHTCCADPRASK